MQHMSLLHSRATDYGLVGDSFFYIYIKYMYTVSTKAWTRKEK